MLSPRTRNPTEIYVRNSRRSLLSAHAMFRCVSILLSSNTKIWFQNRRQKAKLLKKTVEQRTREVLEEATKKTEAEQAQRLHQSETVSVSPGTVQSAESPTTPT